MDRLDFNDFAEQVRVRLDGLTDELCEGVEDARAAYSAAASGALASAANSLAAIATGGGFDPDEIEEMRETFVSQFHAHLDRALEPADIVN